MISYPLPKPARILLLTALLPLLWLASARAATVMNIEIAYMVGTHSHQPQADEIASVVQMFACRGITLNIVLGQAIPHSNVLLLNPTNANIFFGYSGVTNSFGYLRTKYFNHLGQSGWHFCIFGHDYASDTNGTPSGSSGLAEISGANLVVTLGSFTGQIGTPFDRAATLAHEFGHNLGLVHGAVGNFQPNKPSIMSYFYQLQGVHTGLIASGLTSAAASLFKEMDYSDGTMCALNESSLSEQFGSGMVPVDWNCNGSIGGTYSASIDSGSSWCGATNLSRATLPDVNEWAIIHDTTTSLAPQNQPTRTIGCVTANEIRYYNSLIQNQLQPPVISEPCVSARMMYLTAGAVLAGSGLCSDPYTSLVQAQTAATTGSHLFLLPGTYTLDAGPVTLNKPMVIFCNIGTALIKLH